MKLKLDLHPIFSDSASIESALNGIIDEAIAKRASEVEIIPGKGSGALKKSVLRFLDRPDIRSRYHRLEKDSDNWGRLFVHFRHEREPDSRSSALKMPTPTVGTPCACCTDEIKAPVTDPEGGLQELVLDCPWCGSPNRITFRRDRRGTIHVHAELNYQDFIGASSTK